VPSGVTRTVPGGTGVGLRTPGTPRASHSTSRQGPLPGRVERITISGLPRGLCVPWVHLPPRGLRGGWSGGAMWLVEGLAAVGHSPPRGEAMKRESRKACNTTTTTKGYWINYHTSIRTYRLPIHLGVEGLIWSGASMEGTWRSCRTVILAPIASIPTY